VVPLTGERCDDQHIRVLIDDEFEAAHVTAIDLFGLRRIAIVPDLGLAGRTLPGHREINGGTKGALSVMNLTEGAWTQSRTEGSVSVRLSE
jgi:hypothetical protein